MLQSHHKPAGKKLYSYDDLVAAAAGLVSDDRIGQLLPEANAQSLAKILAKNAMNEVLKERKKHNG